MASLGVGDALRGARRGQHRSLADASAHTRIREAYLVALEEEEFAALGGDVYVKGFLRSYAKYLGLDPEELVDTYRRAHPGASDPPLLVAPPVQRTGRTRGPQAGVAVAVVGALLVALAVLGMSGSDDELPAAAAPPPPPTSATTTPPSPPPATPSAAPASTQPAPTVTAQPPPVAFTAVDAVVRTQGGRSYLRVEEGTPAFEGELAEGQSRTFSGAPGLRLRVGNAGVVTLVVDGQDQGPLGHPGQVVIVSCAPGATRCAVEEVTT